MLRTAERIFTLRFLCTEPRNSQKDTWDEEVPGSLTDESNCNSRTSARSQQADSTHSSTQHTAAHSTQQLTAGTIIGTRQKQQFMRCAMINKWLPASSRRDSCTAKKLEKVCRRSFCVRSAFLKLGAARQKFTHKQQQAKQLILWTSTSRQHHRSSFIDLIIVLSLRLGNTAKSTTASRPA